MQEKHTIESVTTAPSHEEVAPDVTPTTLTSPNNQGNSVSSNIVPFQNEQDIPSPFVVEVMLDRHPYASKATALKEAAIISSRLSRGPESISLQELAKSLAMGYTFSPGVMNGPRSKKNWISSQIWGLDFDGGVTVEEILAKCELIGIYPFLIYSTFSHTDSDPHFRALFVTQVPITDMAQRDAIQQALMEAFPECDPHCSDAARIFFGTNKGILHEDWHARISESMVPVNKVTPSKKAVAAASAEPARAPSAAASGTKQAPFLKEAAAALAEDWKQGTRQMKAMALCGWLMRSGWADDAVKELLAEICRLAEDEEPEVRFGAIPSTRSALENPVQSKTTKVTGAQALGKLIANDAVFARVCQCLGQPIPGEVKSNPIPPSLKERNERTDLGNAEAFAEMFSGQLTYVSSPDTDDWRYWNQYKWVSGATDIAIQKAILANDALQQKALNEADENRREAAISHLVKSRSAAKLSNTVNLARRLPSIRSVSSDFNRHRELINHPNGVVNLRNLTLGRHDPKLMITKCANTPYHFDAPEPVNWLRTLKMAFNNDNAFIRWFGKVIGRAFLYGESRDEFYICYGSGANGKSTIFETLRRVFGSDYVETADPSTFMKDNDASRNSLARLQGVKLVIGSESPDGGLFNAALMKRITSGESIEAKFLFKDIFTYTPEFTMFFLTNHKPLVPGTDHGIWRRTVLIPFVHRIPEESRDIHMIQKLVNEEAEGIVRWVYDHVRLYLEEGMGNKPEAVVKATAEYQLDSNTVQNFLDEVCIKNATEKVRLKEFYRVYCAYRQSRGLRAVKDGTLRSDLEKMGVQVPRHSKGHVVMGYVFDPSALEELTAD